MPKRNGCYLEITVVMWIAFKRFENALGGESALRTQIKENMVLILTSGKKIIIIIIINNN